MKSLLRFARWNTCAKFVFNTDPAAIGGDNSARLELKFSDLCRLLIGCTWAPLHTLLCSIIRYHPKKKRLLGTECIDGHMTRALLWYEPQRPRWIAEQIP